MTARYHVNPKTGEPGRCRAVATCPFGDLDSDHYGSQSEARQAFEERMAQSGVTHEPTISFEGSLTRSAAKELQRTLQVLTEAWDSSTAAGDHWSPHNPAQGQCAVSALLVQDLYGGELLRTVNEGESHYWNRLPDGTEIDLTRSQFTKWEPEEILVRERSYLLGSESTVARYGQLKDRASELLKPTPESWAVRYELRHSGVELRLNHSHGGYTVLHGIRVPKDSQKKGLGTAIMEDLVEEADRQGWSLALTPSTDWGASSVSRLKNFYRRFGFLENKGRNRDLTTMESMLRPAKS